MASVSVFCAVELVWIAVFSCRFGMDFFAVCWTALISVFFFFFLWIRHGFLRLLVEFA